MPIFLQGGSSVLVTTPWMLEAPALPLVSGLLAVVDTGLAFGPRQPQPADSENGWRCAAAPSLGTTAAPLAMLRARSCYAARAGARHHCLLPTASAMTGESGGSDPIGRSAVGVGLLAGMGLAGLAGGLGKPLIEHCS